MSQEAATLIASRRYAVCVVDLVSGMLVSGMKPRYLTLKRFLPSDLTGFALIVFGDLRGSSQPQLDCVIVDFNLPAQPKTGATHALSRNFVGDGHNSDGFCLGMEKIGALMKRRRPYLRLLAHVKPLAQARCFKKSGQIRIRFWVLLVLERG
jgi:hypothetical protein